jgi:hypothetical protein
MRNSRDEWRKRMERWRDSGLNAEQFAAKAGINAWTLKAWKYRLSKEGRPSDERKNWPRFVEAIPALVETQGGTVQQDRGFELELGAERRLRIPASFEAEALQRLLAVLERKP